MEDMGGGPRTNRGLRRWRRCPERACGVALLTVVAAIVVAWVVTVTHPDASYAWTANMVSDLGRVTCVTWDDLWVCSPRHALFNIVLVASGVIVAGVATVVRRHWGAPLTVAMLGLGAGLVVLGAIPSDVARGLHMAGAVLALPVPGAGLLVSGMRPDRPWLVPYRRLRAWFGGVCLVVSAGHLLPQHVPFPRGPAEYVGLLAVMVFVLIEGIRLARTPPVLSKVAPAGRQTAKRR